MNKKNQSQSKSAAKSSEFHKRNALNVEIALSKSNKRKSKRNLKKAGLGHDNPLLNSYFKNVNEYDILTAAQERECFAQFHKWKNNRKAGERTRKLGRIAYEKLIGSSLRLVIKIANEYSHTGNSRNLRASTNSLSFEDMISEGNMGLMRAVEKFDPERKVRLSTYAAYWIRQSISRAIEKHARTIRLPSHTQPMLRKITEFVRQYKEEHGEEPSVRTIAQNTKISKANVVNLFSSGVANVASLDTPITAEGNGEGSSDVTLQDVTEDFNTAAPSILAEKDEDVEIIRDFLNRLSKREKYIIMRRFGMDGFDLETLEEIGKRYGISRERIRQIQTVTIRKLRRFSIDTYQKTWADFAG